MKNDFPVIPKIRSAEKADLPAINRIYNYYVRETTSTFQLEPETDAGRLAWFKNHDGRHPVFVAEFDGSVVGWVALSAYSLRGGWRVTAENSVYLDKSFVGRGIGKMLLKKIIAEAVRLDFRSLVARICAEQTASVALHSGVGFVEIGRLREAGEKFGRRLDVVYMQRLLPEPAAGQ